MASKRVKKCWPSFVTKEVTNNTTGIYDPSPPNGNNNYDNAEGSEDMGSGISQLPLLGVQMGAIALENSLAS